MNTTNLQILTGAAPATPAATRPGTGANNGVSDAAQFSQALSREMVQRQNTLAPPPPPMQSKAQVGQRATQTQPQPQARPQAKPAEQSAVQSAAKAPADQPARPAQAASEGASGSSPSKEAAPAEQAAASAQSEPASSPVADMLALMAAFNQPAAAASAVVADPAAAGRAVAGPGNGLLADQLGSAVRPVDIQSVGDTAAAEAFALPTVADGAAPAAATAQALGAQLMPAQPVTPALAKDLKAAPVTALADSEASTDAAPMALGEFKPDTGLPKQSSDAAQPQIRPQATDTAAVAVQGRAEPAQFNAVRSRDATPDTAAISDLQASAAPAAPVQQATVAATNAGAVAAPLADKLAARVGTTAWDNQVGQKIVYMVNGKEQTASMTLNPPDMGPMQIVLSVNNDMASVTFTAAQPEVRQALENAMPKLREMMSESGIELGNATVNSGAPDQRQAQGEQAGPGSQTGSGGGNGNGRVDTNGSAADAQARSAARPRPAGERPGVVDTFA